MKHLIITLSILAAVTFTACSKERTCACSNKNTTTTTKTPRSTGSASTTVSTSESTDETTFSKINKNDLIKYEGCASYSSKSTDSYTTTVFTQTVLSAGGFTYTSTIPQTADVNVSYLYESTCEIK